MPYTSNKKPGALDPALSLGATNNLVVDQNGSVVRATLAQLEAKMFDAKTAKTSVDGSEVVIVRQTDDTLRQVPLNNIVKNGLITNDLVSASAGIVDTKLATINTAGKVTNQAVQATALNTADRIVTRDGSGNFSAGTITATLSGNASTATVANAWATARNLSLTGEVTATLSSVNGSGNVSATATIADDAVTTAKILNANVTTAKIADANVTTAKIADANVTTAKIADSNVTTAKIANDAVTTAKILNANVTTAKIADGAVTAAKIDPAAKINGAQGGGADRVFYENDQTVTTNYTITTNKNAMSAGPITVNNGITVTVPNGSSWTIV